MNQNGGVKGLFPQILIENVLLIKNIEYVILSLLCLIAYDILYCAAYTAVKPS